MDGRLSYAEFQRQQQRAGQPSPSTKPLSYEEYQLQQPKGGLAAGLATGLVRSGASTVGALGTLTGMKPVERFGAQVEERARQYFRPTGTAGTIGEAVGYGVGEIGSALLGGAGVARLATKYAPKVAKALTSASRVQRALGTAAVSAPIDIVQGAKAEEGFVLPGRAGAVAENILLSGGAGALFGGARKAAPAGPGPRVPTPTAPTPFAAPVEEALRAPQGQVRGLLPAPRETPLGPAIPLPAKTPERPAVRRIPVTEPVVPRATPDEVRRYTAGEGILGPEGKPLPATVRPALTEDVARGATMRELERAAEEAAPRMREAKLLDTYPDGTPRATPQEVAAEPYTRGKKAPRNLNDRELDLEYQRLQRAIDESNAAIGEYIGVEQRMATDLSGRGGIMGAPTKGGKASAMTGDMYTSGQWKKIQAKKRGEKGITREKLTIGERYSLGYDLSDEMREAIMEAGYEVPAFRQMVRAAGEAEAALPKLRERFDALSAEHTKRGLSALPEELPPTRGAEPPASVLEELGEGMERQIAAGRRGAVAPELVTTAGGGVLGAGVGAATAPEGQPQEAVARAITGGLVGAGVGAAGLRQLRRIEAGRMAPAVRGSTPDLQAVNATINTGERAVEEAPRWLTPKERFITKWVSETRPLELAAEAGGGKAARTQMEGAISQAQGAPQAALQYLRDRVQAPLSAAREQMDDVRALLKARRDLDLRRRGAAAKSALTDDVLERAVAQGEANPVVRQAADAIRDMHRDLLKMRLDAGILDQATYDAIVASEDFYTPFLREFAQESYQQLGAKGGRWYQRSTGVQRMDRTVEALQNTADPIEVAIASAQRTFRDVGRQRVQNILGDLVEQDALRGLIREVPEDALSSESLRTFKQVRGGQQKVYEVLDPELYDAIATQDARSAGAFMTVARALKNVKTAGITTLPDFAIANVIRDVAASGIQRPDVQRAVREAALGAGLGGVTGAVSGEEENAVRNFFIGAGMGAGIGAYARPMAEMARAIKSIVGNDEVYQRFLREGGSTEGFYIRTPADARAVMQQLGAAEKESIIHPRRWWEALRYVGSVGEQATRLAAFQEALSAGKGVPTAIREAQDRTLRFANVGRGTKDIAAVTPFWNAKVQGWDKLLRLMKQPKTWGLGATMLTAPSVALWQVNKDNPEYWERPVWERNLFWLIPKAEGGFWRVPKPFEIGFLFASFPERALDAAAQAGVLESAAPPSAQPGAALARGAKDIAAATFEGTLPVPEVAALPAQVLLDRDIFRNRPIVTRPSLPTEQQVTPETSAIARQLAKLGVPPEKVDFVLKEIGGTAGKEALRLSDVAANIAGLPAPELERLVQAPVAGQFARRFTTQDRGMSESEAAARDRLRALDKVSAGLRALERGGDPQAVQRYIRENRGELMLENQLRGLQQELDTYTEQRRALERQRGLTQEQRDRMLAAIRQASMETARRINAVGDRP